MARRSCNLWVYLLVCIALPLAALPGNGPRKARLIKDAEKIAREGSAPSEALVVKSESEKTKSSFLGRIVAIIVGSRSEKKDS